MMSRKITNIYILSTPLHVFQASLISRETQKNIFIIDNSLRKTINYKKILQGKYILTKFKSQYSHLVFSTFFAHKKKRSINLYSGNHHHAIVSKIFNQYKVINLYLIDDGLVNYGLQSEKQTPIRNRVKIFINSVIAAFGKTLLSQGHGNNLRLPKKVNATFISLVENYSCPYKNITVEPIAQFINYEEAITYIRTINSDYKLDRKDLYFLSYSQSMKQKTDRPDKFKYQLIYHPRTNKKEKTIDIPYEFIIEDRFIHTEISSIALVKKCFYKCNNFSLIIHNNEKERFQKLNKLIKK